MTHGGRAAIPLAVQSRGFSRPASYGGNVFETVLPVRRVIRLAVLWIGHTGRMKLSHEQAAAVMRSARLRAAGAIQERRYSMAVPVPSVLP